MHTLEWVADLPAQFGTAPIWHQDHQRLYWSDLTEGKLYGFDPVTGKNELCLEDDRPIGGITIQADGSLLLFRDQANVVTWKNGEIVASIIQGIADFKYTNFTSAVAAPCGRVFCSARSDQTHPGRLLYLDLNGRLEQVSDVFGTPASMSFSPDHRHFYFNDAHATHLMTWRFDYDIDTGELSNRTVFRDSLCLHDSGAPFGIALDCTGRVFLSRWDGGSIYQCDDEGVLLQKIELPVKKPTGLCFGGASFDALFMTSAGGHRRQIEGRYAGALAKITLPGCRGFAPSHSRIKLKRPLKTKAQQPRDVVPSV